MELSLGDDELAEGLDSPDADEEFAPKVDWMVLFIVFDVALFVKVKCCARDADSEDVDDEEVDVASTELASAEFVWVLGVVDDPMTFFTDCGSALSVNDDCCAADDNSDEEDDKEVEVASTGLASADFAGVLDVVDMVVSNL
jgi:hypothetical protein